MSGAVWQIASGQFGLISHDQVRDLGLSDAAIRRRVKSGQWEVRQPGVYAMAGSPDSAERQLLAGCLAVGRLAAVSHLSAARRWGLRHPGPPIPEISVDRERGVQLRGLIVHRSRDLSIDQLVPDGPLPVTSPVRTLVDLGQVVPWYVVRDLLETMIARRLVTVAQAEAGLVLHSRRGRRGCGALRRVLEQRALLDRPSESVLEAALAELCRDHDLPPPEYQYAVRVAGGERRLDFAYPELRLAIEVDGFETHATAEGFASDRVRSNELALAGWTVLHFTWHQVVHRPGYVASMILDARRRATTAGR
jgi:very-short-patch-repair endonuclease